LKKEIHGFTPEAGEKMLAHDWQGNIRELRNTIERELLFCKSGWITMAHLSDENGDTGGKKEILCSLREMELRYIKKVLNTTNNNKSKAARILGISRTTLRDKL